MTTLRFAARAKIIYAPVAPVTLNGQPAYAWLEQDPATGEIVDTLPDGGHQIQLLVGWGSLLFIIGFVIGKIYGYPAVGYVAVGLGIGGAGSAKLGRAPSLLIVELAAIFLVAIALGAFLRFCSGGQMGMGVGTGMGMASLDRHVRVRSSQSKPQRPRPSRHPSRFRQSC